MSQNKAAAPVLEHRNGQKRELSQTHKNILLHFVRFGKLFAKTCAVTLTLLGLAAFAGAAGCRLCLPCWRPSWPTTGRWAHGSAWTKRRRTYARNPD